MISERSYARITRGDLKRLLRIAQEDHEDFFSRHPKWKKLYAERIIGVALCQGGALHYIDGRNGVKDFDVWTFYAEHPSAPYPYRRQGHADFGKSKFGCHPDDADRFEGRCVDLIGRSIGCPPRVDPTEAIQTYLSGAMTKTAKELSKKAVVMLAPDKLFGRVIWPT